MINYGAQSVNGFLSLFVFFVYHIGSFNLRLDLFIHRIVVVF